MAVFTIGSSNLSGGGGGGGSDPVDGGSNLTTVGSVPYVSSAGVLNQAPTGLFYDSANVRLGVGTGSPSFPLSFAAATGQKIDLYASGGGYGFGVEANELRISSGSGSIAFRVGSYTGTEAARFAITSGNLLLGGTTDGNYKLDIQRSGSTGTLRIFDQGVTGSTLAVIQAGAAQSGNLLSVRNNAGTEKVYADATGLLVATTIVADYAGSQIKFGGGGGFSQITSAVNGNLLIRNNAGTDFDRLQFGGTTASFPALKRSGGQLLVRLADNSAYASLDSANIYISGSSKGIFGEAVSGISLPNDRYYKFSSTTDAGGTVDAALYRNAAGVLEINNGTAGTYRDLKLRYLNSSANSTGAGSALLGANSPAVTLTAPYTWVEMRANDGSTVYFPVWK